MPTHRICRFKAIAALALIGVAPLHVSAGGFYTAPSNPVYNLGPESAWMNPAGMTGVKTTAVSAGVGVALPINEFDTSFAGTGGDDGNNPGVVDADDGGNAGVDAVFPSGYVVKPIGRWRLGLSILSPTGAVSGTGVDYGDNFVGRYGAIQAKLSSVMIAPSLGYEVNDKLSLGFGVGATRTEFDQTIALSTPGADGRADINELDGWGGMFFAGLTYKLNPATTLGIVYRSSSDVDIDGQISFSNLPVQPPNVDVNVNWKSPQTLQLGLTHAFSPKWIASAELWWEDWSVFSDNRFEVTFVNNVTTVNILDRNFKDVYGGGLAVTHIAGPNIFNLGLAYNSSPVDDRDRTVDLPLDSIFTVSLGFARNVSKSFTYGIGATVMVNGDAQLDQTTQGVRFAGKFDKNIIFLVGGSAQWRF
jgi:long-chain fatty acid transport protein